MPNPEPKFAEPAPAMVVVVPEFVAASDSQLALPSQFRAVA